MQGGKLGDRRRSLRAQPQALLDCAVERLEFRRDLAFNVDDVGELCLRRS